MVNLGRKTIEIPIEHSLSESDLILIRHGETVGQSSIRFYGATDIPLSDIGIQQMKRTGERLKSFRYSQIITSPLSRSRSALTFFGDSNATAKHIIVEDFAEINFGDWEGLTPQEIEQRYPDEHCIWKDKNNEFCYPNGESRSAFFNRVANGSKRILQNVFAPTLAILHKGVIRIILAQLLNMPHEVLSGYSIELGSIQYLRKNETGWNLICHNDTSHLGTIRIPYS